MVFFPSALRRDERDHEANSFFAPKHLRDNDRSSPFRPNRKRTRAIRDKQEGLQRAAADAEDKLAAEVDRVSRELKSKHAAALEEAVKVEREAAEARHVAVLRQAKASREQEAARQVNNSVNDLTLLGVVPRAEVVPALKHAPHL